MIVGALIFPRGRVLFRKKCVTLQPILVVLRQSVIVGRVRQSTATDSLRRAEGGNCRILACLNLYRSQTKRALGGKRVAIYRKAFT